MESLGKSLMAMGVVLIVIGAVVWWSSSGSGPRLGRLPGDIVVERPGFTLYVPIVTMLALSVLATLVLWLIGRGRTP